MVTVSTSALAVDELQAACAQNADSLDQVIACLKAAGRTVTPDRSTDQGCEFAHRGPFSAPMQGRTVVRFGERTQFGSTSRGVVLEGQPASVVQAPKSGIILYAGEFRTYGKLVILETACELRFLLAGLSTLTVNGGDAVVAGQPIGVLSATATQTNLPVLYVELRKSGKSVDPGADISGP